MEFIEKALKVKLTFSQRLGYVSAETIREVCRR